MVNYSPWPIMSSLALASLMASSLGYLSGELGLELILVQLVSLAGVTVMWWRDVIRESTFQGFHTSFVQKGLEIGFVMFILSEVMFFFSLFFSYFFTSLSPDVELGLLWPPRSLQFVDYKGVALLNTVLLLSSGASITWTHYSILSRKFSQAVVSLIFTVSLAMGFLGAQAWEYYSLSFTMSDSVFGSLFYMMTGFHGLHVLVGLIYIICTLIRLQLNQMSDRHHKGFEFSAWYWHFVDVVWLLLFVVVYWWNSPN